MNIVEIDIAKDKFGKLLEKHLIRVDEMKKQDAFIDYKALNKIVIGVCGGDGIGPSITSQAQRVLEYLLKSEIIAGKIEFRMINGLTIEKRAATNSAIPSDVLEELKKCHVILKGPTTTPRKGDEWPNVESANVAMRKDLDLFANVRPVRVPHQGIDWIFFRENTEGGYAAGKEGIDVNDDLAIDFTIATSFGCERIIRAAFEYAKLNNKTRITAVTKANIIKATDGKFIDIYYRIAKEYPHIYADDWYIDIMTAKLIDEKRRNEFQVFVLPNLYGDILTDEAAEFQGGVGTAGSANIGIKYSMFEAIHGSAPRMVKEGREIYADPCSIIKAGSMLLSHIGYKAEADKILKALDICTVTEKKIVITGRESGATSEQFTNYILDIIGKN
jgi:isocitrate dehydrogenase (NAD+)